MGTNRESRSAALDVEETGEVSARFHSNVDAQRVGGVVANLEVFADSSSDMAATNH
ncbi:MAG: hypothetical protein ACI8TP_003961 [Acidimicrobiales bacterium]|jgi:hypothetical protein